MKNKPTLTPPILRNKRYDRPSVFRPKNLLREARRQKNIPTGTIPQLCILDPDGDIVRQLVAAGRATRHPCWACYHTDLYRFEVEDLEFGIIGCAIVTADRRPFHTSFGRRTGR